MGAGLIEIDQRRGVLSGSMALSVLLHVLVVMVLLWTGLPGTGGDSGAVLSNEEVIRQQEREEELRLGLNEAESASIDWLGIEQREAVRGEAEISETEQAAQTTAVGEEQVNEPVLVQQQIEVVEEAVQESEQAEQIERAEQAIEELTVEPVAEPIVEPVLEQTPLDEGEGVVIATIEETVEQPIEESVDQTVKQTSEQAAETQEQSSTAPAESATQAVDERPRGTAGVLSEREVVATRIKRAIEVDPYKPNAPVAGKGLEIITVRPRYSSTIRMSAVPKNPIVLIYFNSAGKVVKAEFLRDRRVVYSSGVVGVDEPLLNAIYQWKAKGKQIDEIEGDDLVEVSIKIVFRRERSSSTD
jgi:hypothetical protein